MSVYITHVIFLEEAEVADDSYPYQQGGGAQQDPAHVISRYGLSGRNGTVRQERHATLGPICRVRPAPGDTDLSVDADLHEAAGDGEQVADDEEDVPAVDELHPVGPAHAAAEVDFEEEDELLRRARGGAD